MDFVVKEYGIEFPRRDDMHSTYDGILEGGDKYYTIIVYHPDSEYGHYLTFKDSEYAGDEIYFDTREEAATFADKYIPQWDVAIWEETWDEKLRGSLECEVVDRRVKRKWIDIPHPIEEAVRMTNNDYASKLSRPELEDTIWEVLSQCIDYSIADTFYMDTHLDPEFDSLDEVETEDLIWIVNELNKKGYLDQQFYEDQKNGIDWEPGKYIIRK